jgi:molybdopterin molybdotransferase
MINYSEAIEIIKSYADAVKLKSVNLPLFECSGLTLAEDVIADVDFPSYDNSAMDGYAVKYAEGVTAWKIIGDITAGNNPEDISIGSNAVRIMTGGKIPNDADTILPKEDVIIENDYIRLAQGVFYKKGAHVRHKAEYLVAGKVAVERLTILKPHHLTVAASCGYAGLSVFLPLRIGVLSTGDELIDYEQKPTGDKVRATNTLSLSLAIEESGMRAVPFSRNALDNKEDIKEKISTALSENIDILVTSGGVSVGEHDYVQDVLIELGARVIFWKVNVKPGKPFLFSVIEFSGKKILIFSFPGNPVSAFVNFNIFLKPFINKLYNRNSFYLSCRMTNNTKKKDGKRHFILGNFNQDPESGEFTVSTLDNLSSGNITNLANFNCLIIFEEDKNILRDGEIVRCMMI